METPPATPPSRPAMPAGRTAPTSEVWDVFVAANDLGSCLQTTAWAKVKAANGWRAQHIVASTGDGPIGAQVLTIAAGPLPWSFGYAPRGPLATAWTAEAVTTFAEVCQQDPGLRGQRVAHIRIDPAVERSTPSSPHAELVQAMAAAGWRPAPSVQPVASRIIDLAADEATLWADLRSKWRQYVTRAARNGIRIVEVEGDRLSDFYRIYRETAVCSGFLIRTEQACRDVWDAFRPAGLARLLLAEGVPQAALFLVRSAGRVIEPYGGMTVAGAASRANYLLNWEAIRSSREAGATSYDLWGLVHPGIDQFKAGFGGRIVHYIGAWDLVLDPVGHALIGLATRARALYVDRVRRRSRPPLRRPTVRISAGTDE